MKAEHPDTYPQEFELFNPGFVVHDIDNSILQNLNHPLFDKIITLKDEVVAVINYSTLQYPYISDNIQNIFGYSKEEWIERGMHGMASYAHPDDLAFLSDQVYPSIFSDFMSLSAKDKKRFKSSYTYRIKKNGGNYITILQHSTALSIENDKVILSLSVCSDISAFKKDTTVIFRNILIDENNPTHLLSNSVPAKSAITPKEVELLELLSKGYSEKQMSERLSVSIQTIKTHKRNLMRKTGSANASHLVQYALANLII